MPTVLDEALALAGRGWPVFPVQPAIQGDDKSGKKPYAGTHGFQEATTNPVHVERFWDRWPEANLGVATGKLAKVWVLDVDPAKGGNESLSQLEEELGELPVTLEVTTGSGGRHLYFAWPEGREIRNKQNLRPGIDVRGEGGYVIAPPSGHWTGGIYRWSGSSSDPIYFAPPKWVDFVCPPKPAAVAPWERANAPAATRSSSPILQGGKLPILERAKLYLQKVDPAVQGSGGHDALLWAARCLVVGFLLDDAKALELLWSDYNPRCTPQWNAESPVDRKDFERKVVQARSTPAGKPPGWLLDEFGLRDEHAAEKSRLLGETSAAALLASAQKRALTAPETIVAPAPKAGPPPVPERRPFPIEHLPAPIRDFCLRVSESNNVDTSFTALPALAVAGAAMGNAWRLALKRGFEVPPILWVCIIGGHGTNKTSPLKAIVEAIRRSLGVDEIPDVTRNPQGRVVVQEATLEAVVSRMQDSRRGILIFRDELKGWIKSFGQFKKGGGADEQAWLEFWGGNPYMVDRKTNNEQIFIPAASVSVLGGIQPKVLSKLFDPDRFESGFVPRVLIACPPLRSSYWNEHEIDPEAEEKWASAITWLRCTPFVGMDTTSGTFLPRVVQLLDNTAPKAVYTTFFNAVALEIDETADDNVRGFLAKARTHAGRLALIHHGLSLACGSRNADDPISVESVRAGTEWARWCLEEQLRVYGFGSVVNSRDRADELLKIIQTKSLTKSATVRQVMRWNGHKFPEREKALAAMALLVEQGYARWKDEARDQVVLNEGVKT